MPEREVTHNNTSTDSQAKGQLKETGHLEGTPETLTNHTHRHHHHTITADQAMETVLEDHLEEKDHPMIKETEMTDQEDPTDHQTRRA